MDNEQIPLCACGCGEPVRFNKKYKKWNKYLKEHKGRAKKAIPNKIIYQDENTTKILLESSKFGNKECIIDTEDYDKIKKFRWYILHNIKGHSFYAITNIYKNKKRLGLLLHRVIMSPPKEVLIDHVNHNGLDNRKNNLRLCTHQENSRNCKKYKSNKNIFKGVRQRNELKKWQARLKFNDKTIHLGSFDDPIQAAKAYNEKAKELFGEFSCLNEIPGE